MERLYKAGARLRPFALFMALFLMNVSWAFAQLTVTGHVKSTSGVHRTSTRTCFPVPWGRETTPTFPLSWIIPSDCRPIRWQNKVFLYEPDFLRLSVLQYQYRQVMLCNSCKCFFTCYRTLAIAYMSRVWYISHRHFVLSYSYFSIGEIQLSSWLCHRW